MELTHLLDTGWVVRHLRASAPHTETMRRIGPGRLAVSIVMLAELAEGVYRANDPAAARRAVETFLVDKAVLGLTAAVCDRFGRERAALRGRNLLIGDMDLFIAATCLEHGLILLSPNLRHFERMPGLDVISEPLP